MQFTSIVVARNYKKSGKDFILGVLRWGMHKKGKSIIPIAFYKPTPNGNATGLLEKFELQVLQKFYPNYRFYNVNYKAFGM
jgi:hypothetical protein